MSFKRHKMNRGSSKKYFSRSASGMHRKNGLSNAGLMRGGIRL